MRIQSLVFTLAHQIKSQFKTWKEAIQTAWNRVRLIKSLSKRPTKFTFAKKQTGELRTALGFIESDLSHRFDSDFNFNRFCVIRFQEIVTKAVDGVKTTFNQWRSLDVRFLVSIG